MQIAPLYPHIRYGLLPARLQGGVRRYLEFGIPPGGFLTAVIHNDLFEALGRADEINSVLLRDICRWFYSEAPSSCYRSAEAMVAWQEAHYSRYLTAVGIPDERHAELLKVGRAERFATWRCYSVQLPPDALGILPDEAA